MNRWFFPAVIAVLFWSPAPSYSNEFDFDEEVVSEKKAVGEPDSPKKETSSLPLRFNAGMKLGRQTGRPMRWVSQALDLNTLLDWSTPVGVLYGEGNLRWNRAFHTENDPEETVDAWQEQGILRELYWSPTWGAVSLGVGRQIVVVGKGDFLSILDLISPADQTQLFFADPEDARLGQDLLKVSVYPFPSHSLSLLYSPQARGNRMVDRGHPYQFHPPFELSSRRLREWNAIYRFNQGRLELSLNAGKVHQRVPLLYDENSNGDPLGEFRPFSYGGLAATWTLTGWLLKAELAEYKDYSYQTYSQAGLPRVTDRDVRAAMLGFDFNHSEWGSFTVEGNVLIPEVKDQDVRSRALYALSWSKPYLRDDLQLTLSHLGFDRMANQLNRFSMTYRLNDIWTVAQQYTHIMIKDNDFQLYENLDRLDISLHAGFGL